MFHLLLCYLLLSQLRLLLLVSVQSAVHRTNGTGLVGYNDIDSTDRDDYEFIFNTPPQTMCVCVCVCVRCVCVCVLLHAENIYMNPSLCLFLVD